MAQRQCESGPIMGELYLPGTPAPAGLYRLVGTNIKILLKKEGSLPASLDGRMACYEPVSSGIRPLSQSQGRQPE